MREQQALRLSVLGDEDARFKGDEVTYVNDGNKNARN